MSRLATSLKTSSLLALMREKRLLDFRTRDYVILLYLLTQNQ